MKCRLCDRPTAAATGKLCADCTRALQRARGAALSKLSPAAAVAAKPTRAPPITLTVAPPEAATGRPNRSLLWVAAAGLVAIALVYVVQEVAMPGGTIGQPAVRPPATMTERVNVEPAPVVTRVEEPSWTTVVDAGNTATSAGAPDTLATAAKAAVPTGKAGAKPAKGGAQDSKSMALPLAADHDVAAPKPAEADPHQQLAGAKVALPAQPVDGAQVLASAMQKCGNESLFSKFICEQKTYLAYCEDKWDKDPKCMRKVGER